MTNPKIKICGVKTIQIAQAVVDADAHMLGLVFVEKSPRNIDLQTAKKITSQFQNQIQIVALLMNPDDTPNLFMQIQSTVKPHLYQLHGRSDITASKLPPQQVIRTTPFNPDTITQTLAHYHNSNIHGLVIDTPDPSNVGGVGGGTGNTFNWQELRNALDHTPTDTPIILAGGLHPQNVANAIKIIQPAVVDVSSGVEHTRGQKDIQLIQDFCQAARSNS